MRGKRKLGLRPNPTAGLAHGTPRATNGIEIVIALTRDQLRALLSEQPTTDNYLLCAAGVLVDQAAVFFPFSIERIPTSAAAFTNVKKYGTVKSFARPIF